MQTKLQNMHIQFAPSLSLKVVAPAVEFYKKAFGVTELRLFTNDDGSVHVAELLFGDSVFFLHEEMSNPDSERAPESLNGTTTVQTLFADDPDALMVSALAAGARQIHPMEDHFYGYRQGVVIDPFGHQWMFQKRI